MTNQTTYNRAFWNTMRFQQEAKLTMRDMADSTSGYPVPPECTASYTGSPIKVLASPA